MLQAIDASLQRLGTDHVAGQIDDATDPDAVAAMVVAIARAGTQPPAGAVAELSSARSRCFWIFPDGFLGMGCTIMSRGAL